jgi:hypothetical protein
VPAAEVSSPEWGSPRKAVRDVAACKSNTAAATQFALCSNTLWPARCAAVCAGSGCPCFKNRLGALQGLKKRFNLALPEPQLVEAVLGLISDSLDAWRTRQVGGRFAR